MTVTDLLKLNVNDKVEKKGNLSYLSWAWAWAEALKADPAATFDVQMFDGKPYVDINGTALVFVTVTLFGKPMTCQLPVMDHRNKAIPNPDAFAMNTAIMRCMTKALSLHGLGLYIYAGEDLPEADMTLIDSIVAEIKALYEKEDHAGMYGVWEAITDNEVRLSVWSILQPDSKIRSAIKAYKNKLEESK